MIPMLENPIVNNGSHGTAPYDSNKDDALLPKPGFTISSNQWGENPNGLKATTVTHHLFIVHEDPKNPFLANMINYDSTFPQHTYLHNHFRNKIDELTSSIGEINQDYEIYKEDMLSLTENISNKYYRETAGLILREMVISLIDE